MSTAKQAARIMMLVEEGMSLEDAIQKVLAETAPVTQDNRIEHIMKLENAEFIEDINEIKSLILLFKDNYNSQELSDDLDYLLFKVDNLLKYL